MPLNKQNIGKVPSRLDPSRHLMSRKNCEPWIAILDKYNEFFEERELSSLSQTEYVNHNVSATWELRENEIEEVVDQWISNAIQEGTGYVSAFEIAVERLYRSFELYKGEWYDFLREYPGESHILHDLFVAYLGLTLDKALSIIHLFPVECSEQTVGILVGLAVEVNGLKQEQNVEKKRLDFLEERERLRKEGDALIQECNALLDKTKSIVISTKINTIL